jgi:hypothetical protein
VLNDNTGIFEDTNMKAEVESALRRTQTGRHLVEACKSDSDMAAVVEEGYADRVG